MKMSRLSEPQPLAVLRQAEGCGPVPELWRRHGMAGNSVALRLPAEPSRSARPAFVTAPSLSRTVRHDSLDQHIVESTEEALQFATNLPSAHNHERIRSARLAKRSADTVKTT